VIIYVTQYVIHNTLFTSQSFSTVTLSLEFFSKIEDKQTEPDERLQQLESKLTPKANNTNQDNTIQNSIVPTQPQLPLLMHVISHSMTVNLILLSMESMNVTRVLPDTNVRVKILVMLLKSSLRSMET